MPVLASRFLKWFDFYFEQLTSGKSLPFFMALLAVFFSLGGSFVCRFFFRCRLQSRCLLPWLVQMVGRLVERWWRRDHFPSAAFAWQGQDAWSTEWRDIARGCTRGGLVNFSTRRSRQQSLIRHSSEVINRVIIIYSNLTPHWVMLHCCILVDRNRVPVRLWDMSDLKVRTLSVDPRASLIQT